MSRELNRTMLNLIVIVDRSYRFFFLPLQIFTYSSCIDYNVRDNILDPFRGKINVVIYVVKFKFKLPRTRLKEIRIYSRNNEMKYTKR